jgi:hypothetical protein
MSGWPKSALYTSVGLVALGFIGIFFAWNGAASKDYVQGQMPYVISGGIGGLALVLSGLTVVVVQAVRRDAAELRQKLEELTEVLRERDEVAPAPTPRRRRAS